MEHKLQQNGKNKKESSSLTEWSGAVGSSPNDLLTFSIYTPTLLATHSALHRSVCMHTHTHTVTHSWKRSGNTETCCRHIPEPAIFCTLRDVSLLLSNSHTPQQLTWAQTV